MRQKQMLSHSLITLITVATVTCVQFFSAQTFAQEKSTPESQQRALLLEHYMKTKDAIEANNRTEFVNQATALQTDFKKMRLKGIPGQHLNRMMILRDSLRNNANQLVTFQNSEDIQSSFSDISTQLWSLMDVMQFSDNPIYLQYCPMEDSYWLHADKKIRNPYSPIDMPTCGKIVGNVTKENYKVEDCCNN